jgi:hypothetical protein
MSAARRTGQVVNYIVKIRMSTGGTTHHHIAEVGWHVAGDSSVKTCSRESMAQAINGGADVRTPATATAREAKVHVVPGTTFIQTAADGNWTNNLLALPRY